VAVRGWEASDKQEREPVTPREVKRCKRPMGIIEKALRREQHGDE